MRESVRVSSWTNRTTVIGAVQDGCHTASQKYVYLFSVFEGKSQTLKPNNNKNRSDRTPQAKTPHYLKKKGRKKKKRRKKVQSSDSDSDDEIQSPVKLPRGFEVNEGMYVNFKVENHRRRRWK